MALLTKKDFAKKVGKNTKWLASYIGRGKVVVVQKGDEVFIDTKDSKNIAFLQQWAIDHIPAAEEQIQMLPGKQKPLTLDLSELENGNELPASDDNGEYIPPYHISETKLKHLDTKKRQKEVEKLELDIEKKRGEVVPVEPIATLVFQFKQHVLTQQKMSYERFLSEISHKYSIIPADMAAYRAFFIKELNTATEEATKSFEMHIETTLNEFAVKKGIGERG